MPLIMIISAFAALISSGGAPKASICMGRGDKEGAEKILGSCFGVQILLSVLLTVILLKSNRELLLAFGASKNTIEFSESYMNIYALGTIFIQLTLGMGAFITAQGFAAMGMVTVLVGAVSNIILDPVFIFWLDMGVRGAAVATVLSQALSCAWVMIFLQSKVTHLKLKRKYMQVDFKVVLPCLALGLSTFVMQSTESLISVCFNSSLLKYGGDIAVGAMTILTSVMQFAMLPMQGIAQGAQPICSYNFGARNVARVKQTYFLLLRTCLIYSASLWLLIQRLPRFFAGIFTPDPVLLDFTAPMLRIYCGGLLLFGIQIACQMTFVSIGSALSSITVAVVRKLVLLIPLIYIIPHLVSNPTVGVYLAEPIADILAVTFTSILFFFQFRKALRKLEEPA